MSQIRETIHVIPGQDASDGAGVRMKRVFPVQGILQIDPFLLFDEFGSDDPDAYIGGFPDHPHRGFETVTYMLAGRMRHFDNKGNSGLLTAGGAQWMTAGRGLVHSEMPEQTDGLMRGFQIWVNLPAAEKMTAPRYQDYAPSEIPEKTLEGGITVKVVAGEAGGIAGPVNGVSRQPLLVDVTLPAGTAWQCPVDPAATVLVHVFEGAVTVGDELVPAAHMAVTVEGDTVSLQAGPEGGRALILAARPIGEPVVRAGPFVMNTRAEIEQAFQDYQAGRFG
ncbi:pirin family protein [Dongia sp.]|uniref:pirin family protein n=1 Tax=Dongia sp. TaxID=1977262 RepID=UPI0035B16B2F